MAEIKTLDGQEHWLDAQGRYTPLATIKEADRMRDDLVEGIAAKFKEANLLLVKTKREVFADLFAFIDLSASQYNVKLGGKKGNLTLYSYNGKYKVELQVQEFQAFDERLQVAKKLIDECMEEWVANGREEAKVLLYDVFAVNKQGKVNATKILALKRHDFKGEKWERAMEIIHESVLIVNSKNYMRVYERIGNTDQYNNITLNFAAIV